MQWCGVHIRAHRTQRFKVYNVNSIPMLVYSTFYNIPSDRRLNKQQEVAAT